MWTRSTRIRSVQELSCCGLSWTLYCTYRRWRERLNINTHEFKRISGHKWKMHISSDMCINLAFMLPSVYTALRFDCTVSKIHSRRCLREWARIRKLKNKKTNIATILSVAEIWAHREAKHKTLTSSSWSSYIFALSHRRRRALTAARLTEVNTDDWLRDLWMKTSDYPGMRRARGMSVPRVIPGIVRRSRSTRERITNSSSSLIFVVTRRYRARRMYTYTRICNIRQER